MVHKERLPGGSWVGREFSASSRPNPERVAREGLYPALDSPVQLAGSLHRPYPDARAQGELDRCLGREGRACNAEDADGMTALMTSSS